MKLFKQLSLLFISTALVACSLKTADSMTSKNMISKNRVLQNTAFSQIQKKWQLESIDGTPISAEISSTLAIDPQRQATGRLACNNFFGRLELKDNTLKIDQMGSTRMLCAGVMNEIEMIVSSVLNNRSEINFTNNRLSLTGQKHTLIYRADR